MGTTNQKGKKGDRINTVETASPPTITAFSPWQPSQSTLQVIGRSGDQSSHQAVICIHEELEQPLLPLTSALVENPLTCITRNHLDLSFPEQSHLTLHNDSVISYIRIGKILTVRDICGQ